MHTDIGNNLYLYTHLSNGDVAFNIEYDRDGVIRQLTTFVETLGLVSLDLNYLQIDRPSRYAYVQEKVNEGLEYFRKHSI